MSTSLLVNSFRAVRMANLLAEEPDALMCARPDLWERWVSNHPTPPGPKPLRCVTPERPATSTWQSKVGSRMGMNAALCRPRSVLKLTALVAALIRSKFGRPLRVDICG